MCSFLFPFVLTACQVLVLREPQPTRQGPAHSLDDVSDFGSQQSHGLWQHSVIEVRWLTHFLFGFFVHFSVSPGSGGPGCSGLVALFKENGESYGMHLALVDCWSYVRWTDWSLRCLPSSYLQVLTSSLTIFPCRSTLTVCALFAEQECVGGVCA
jgi:hypothetical protein